MAKVATRRRVTLTPAAATEDFAQQPNTAGHQWYYVLYHALPTHAKPYKLYRKKDDIATSASSRSRSSATLRHVWQPTALPAHGPTYRQPACSTTRHRNVPPPHWGARADLEHWQRSRSMLLNTTTCLPHDSAWAS